MDIAISLLMTAAINTAGYFIVKKRFKEEKLEYSRKRRVIFLAVTAVLMAACGTLFPIFAVPDEWTLFSLLRAESVICWTYYAAVVDFKLRVIPNEIIIGMLINLMAIFIPEALSDISGFAPTIVMSLIGGVTIGGIFLLGRALSKGGMGMGDVKLTAVCGFFLGLDDVIGMVFWSLVFSVLAGLGLIIAKRAKMKSKLPMAPFFFLGALTAHVLYIISGM